MAEKTAATRLVIPANPTSSLIAALVFEGRAPLEVLDELAAAAVAEDLDVEDGLGL